MAKLPCAEHAEVSIDKLRDYCLGPAARGGSTPRSTGGREPILITQHGVPSAYLVDVESYEALQKRMSLLEGIARGEKALEEGRALTHTEAKRRMARWLK